jgi:hypothetical protein
MAEYVRHEVNGLFFEHRSVASLAAQMQRSSTIRPRGTLGARGYLFSPTGDIPDGRRARREVEELYDQVLAAATHAHREERSPGPGASPSTPTRTPATCAASCARSTRRTARSAPRKAAGKPRRLMPIRAAGARGRGGRPHGLREIIPSTMGEPLLYEHFEEILELCRDTASS